MKIIVAFYILLSQSVLASNFDQACEIQFTTDQYGSKVSATIGENSYLVDQANNTFKINLYREQRRCIMNSIIDRESDNSDGKCVPKTAFDVDFQVIKYQFEIDGIRVSNQLRPSVLAKIIEICKRGL